MTNFELCLTLVSNILILKNKIELHHNINSVRFQGLSYVLDIKALVCLFPIFKLHSQSTIMQKVKNWKF